MERIKNIQSKIASFGVEGILFFDLTNIRYLTGFTGSAGILFIGIDRAILTVDGRYTTQAGSETRGCEIVESSDNVTVISGIISDLRLKSVGFDASAISFEDYLKLREKVGSTKLKPLSKDLNSLRVIKSKGELDLLRKAISISADSLQKTLEEIVPGSMERDIALELEFQMIKAGGEKRSFDTIVASGTNSALPHARPRSRKIEVGDFVIIDYGVVYEGYHSDETCTFAVETVTEEQKKIYNIVKDAHDRALDAVKAGISCRYVDEVARGAIEEAGYGQYFCHGTGHGVGLDVHEAPKLSRESTDYLEEGMVITVEPGIYLPDAYGVRIEDMAFVQKDGCEILTVTSKDLNIL
ncbi:MAG: aminopeptidase P family protein [Deltaproteobacteria bacterium]|nr:aminopeptidase P family protein [Deltaproteobacteria bacterium]